MRLGLALLVCVCAFRLQAADKTWLGASSANWGDAATWSPASVPGSAETVSISNAATATLTVQSGTAAVAASLSFDNASGKNVTLAIANGASLAVGGAITKTGAGNATVSVVNNTPTNAAGVLTAASLAATTLMLSSTTADQTLTTGFDLSLVTQLQLGAGTVNQNLTYRQTNGTISVANSDYGLCLLEGYARPTAGVQTFILDGGTLKADRIGVGNGNGNNSGSIDRYAGNGVVEFNNGTVSTRFDGGSVWIENGSALEAYNGSSVKVRDTQRNTSKPVAVRLSQSGTHTFKADGSAGRIVVSPSAQLTDKAGEAGTLAKTGLGALVFTGGGLTATNDWSGDTTVLQGSVKVDYSLIAGAAGSLALNNAYSPRSKLNLNGGSFELVGRGNATNSTFSGVTVTSGGGFAESYNITLPTTAGLVVGQSVANAFLPAGTYIRRINSGTSVGLSHMSTSTVAQAGQTLDFGAANFTSGQAVSNVEFMASASTVTVTQAGVSTLLAFHNVAGSGGLVKAGNGTLRLTGSVALAGTNTISAGTLDFAGAGYTLLTNAVTGAGVFRQSGAGTTAVIAASASINTFSGAVVVDGGTLMQGLGTATQRRGLSGALSFTVNSGGLLLTARDAMNDGATYSLNGGTLKAGGGFQCLGPLALSGGSLVTGTGSGGPWQAFALNGNVVVTGAVPSVIRADPGLYNGVHLVFNSAAGALRTFRVEDVTGNADADLTVSANLQESSHTGSSAGLVKTGAGTLVLAGATNVYSGATIVSNGTLLVSNGGVSNSAVTVVSGAAFGTADTSASRVASLTLAEGAKLVWAYNGSAHAAGSIAVTGTLSLPASATLDIGGTGFLYSNQVLFSAGEVTGATDLSGWTIRGVPENVYVVRVGNTLVLRVGRATVINLK